MTSRHAYTNPAMMELLVEARRRAGVLAPAQFAWLKLVDRRLWYALHSLGYETDGFGRYLHPNPRVEAIGARDHWAAERAAGAPVIEPNLSRADRSAAQVSGEPRRARDCGSCCAWTTQFARERTLDQTSCRRSAAMHVEIPEGANVQIIVGSATPLALADESRQAAHAPNTRPTGPQGLGRGDRAGRHIRGRSAFRRTGELARKPQPPRLQCHGLHRQVSNTRSPTPPLPNPQRQQASGGVPPEFQRELRQPPTVIAATRGGIRPRTLRPGAIDLAVARQIVGPQEQFERTGAQSLRDIRPFTTRLSEGLRSSASGHRARDLPPARRSSSLQSST